jgi:histidyl-tRNA synthetase
VAGAPYYRAVKFQTIKGTADRLPREAARWANVVAVARRILENAGAGEIHTPVFEETGVFLKGVGESSDIVRKEMYRFSDRGERDLTLRPEATAPIVRAYIEHGMKVLPSPVKLWTFEPMFRAEKPQKGRERQFHQVGLEAIGLDDSLIDAEVIDLGLKILEELGLTGLTLHLGSVGDPEDRDRYNAYLRETLSPVAERLSEDSRERLELNPMRLLDSKDRADQALLRELQVRPMLDFLGAEAAAHFAAVQDALRAFGRTFEVDPTIVRGLDYYRRTAFEVKHPRLGAQSTVLAGGRYDGLIELLGGPPTPAVGWGAGVERILLAQEADGVPGPAQAGPLAVVIPLDAESLLAAATTARSLREVGPTLQTYRPRALGKALGDAEKLGARYAVLIGSAERESGKASVKELSTREQSSVPFVDLPAWLAGRREARHLEEAL